MTTEEKILASILLCNIGILFMVFVVGIVLENNLRRIHNLIKDKLDYDKYNT